MKNFIWDFDGTLFDSYPHITNAFCAILNKYKIKHNQNEVSLALQISHDYAYEKYSLTSVQIKEFKVLSNNCEFKPLIVPFSETKEVLKYIGDNFGENYIYTHRDNETLLFYLNKYDLVKYFKDFITFDDGFERKPSSEAIEFLLKKYNLNKDETIMIGDREIDVLSGINAKINGGLISFNNETVNTKANYYFNSLKDIKSLI